MLSSSIIRKLLVRVTPVGLYPKIRSMMNHPAFQRAITALGISLYSPAWHTITAGPFRGIALFVDPESQEFSRQMLAGNYDAYFYTELLKHRIKGKIIFDIGAHIGFSTLTFAYCVGTKGQVVAFEPNAENFTRLQQNLQRNPALASQTQIYPFALAAKNGKETFVFSRNIEDGSSSGSFLQSAHTHLQKSVYEEDFGFVRRQVVTKTLDSFIRSKKIVPDILKIDVEGAEASVLEGASECIRTHHPTLYIELHSVYASLQVTQFLLNEHYSLEVLHTEADGRVFVVATHKPNYAILSKK
jgi:FkbM family methyltransferase